MEFASLTQCPMCDKLLDANDAILHMAITHNNLDSLLPPEHRIAKSKRGRKKKNVTKDWCKQVIPKGECGSQTSRYSTCPNSLRISGQSDKQISAPSGQYKCLHKVQKTNA